MKRRYPLLSEIYREPGGHDSIDDDDSEVEPPTPEESALIKAFELTLIEKSTKSYVFSSDDHELENVDSRVGLEQFMAVKDKDGWTVAMVYHPIALIWIHKITKTEGDKISASAPLLKGAFWELRHQALKQGSKVIAEYIEEILRSSNLERLLEYLFSEDIRLDIDVGDVVLTGKWKNKRTVVKSIGTDDLGQPTINGQSLLAMRIEKELPDDKKSKQTKEEEAAKKHG